MIIDLTCYTIVCDNCSKDSNKGSDVVGWGDLSSALDVAMCDDWEVLGNKHYCSDCYEYDDDDQIIIKN